MSLLVSLLTDLDQKTRLNEYIDEKRKAGDMYKFLADDHQTPATRLDPSMLLATFYYKSVDPLYFLQQDVSRNLMQDGDPETFAMLLSMKLPDDAIKVLPPTATTSDGQLISDMDATAFDLVVGDLTGQDDALSLLDYALNLSPRDTITRDLAKHVSAFEPRLPEKPPPLPQQRSIFG